MLQNIKEIGIFMILAQAVVHFAPGRQYEKYIKSISGVIILLLFLRPFVQVAGGQWQEPAAVLEGIRETAKLPELSADLAKISGAGVEEAVTERMEEELAARLNRELAGEDCFVKQVRLILAERMEPSEEEVTFSVEVVVGERRTDDSGIAVEKITIGTGKEGENGALEAVRLRIADLLGLEENCVEVKWDG